MPNSGNFILAYPVAAARDSARYRTAPAPFESQEAFSCRVLLPLRRVRTRDLQPPTAFLEMDRSLRRDLPARASATPKSLCVSGVRQESLPSQVRRVAEPIGREGLFQAARLLQRVAEVAVGGRHYFPAAKSPARRYGSASAARRILHQRVTKMIQRLRRQRTGFLRALVLIDGARELALRQENLGQRQAMLDAAANCRQVGNLGGGFIRAAELQQHGADVVANPLEAGIDLERAPSTVEGTLQTDRAPAARRRGCPTLPRTSVRL